MKDTDNTFKWTDELVKEFIHRAFAPSDPNHAEVNKFMEKFIKSKTEPVNKPLPERIEVDDLYVDEVQFGINPIRPNYHFNLKSSFIPQHKFPDIKQAIENVLNDCHPQPAPKTDTVVADIRDNQIELLKEDLECVHLYLDDLGMPRKDKGVGSYSIVGRIKQLEKHYMQKLSEIETEYLSKQKTDTGKDSKEWTPEPNAKTVTDNSDVLFTTEDGIDITDVNDKVWLILVTKCGLSESNACHVANNKTYIKSNFLVYSTKEAAEQYILENKPCLSLKEINECIYSASLVNISDRCVKSDLQRILNKKITQKLKQ